MKLLYDTPQLQEDFVVILKVRIEQLAMSLIEDDERIETSSSIVQGWV